MAQSLRAVQTIEDPAKRARGAARIAREAQAKADAARSKRDAAALSLSIHEGAKPVEVYRLIGVSRGLFVRMSRRAPSDLPRLPDARKEAAKQAKVTAKWDLLAQQARAVRDLAAYEMKDGGQTNADVARATELTTARVAKLFERRRAEQAAAEALAAQVTEDAEAVPA